MIENNKGAELLKSETGRSPRKRLLVFAVSLLLLLLGAAAVAAATRGHEKSVGKVALKPKESATSTTGARRPDRYDAVISALHGPKFFPVDEPQDAYVIWIADGGNGHEVLTVQYRSFHVDICAAFWSPCQGKNRVIKTFKSHGTTLSLEYGPLGQNPSAQTPTLPKSVRAWWLNEKLQGKRPKWLEMRYYPGDSRNRPNAKATNQ